MLIQDVINLLESKQSVHLKFRKRTGNREIREMKCHTGETSKLAKEPTKAGLPFQEYDLVGVFDEEKQAYRAIPIEGITEICINDVWIKVIHNQIAGTVKRGES